MRRENDSEEGGLSSEEGCCTLDPTPYTLYPGPHTLNPAPEEARTHLEVQGLGCGVQSTGLRTPHTKPQIGL